MEEIFTTHQIAKFCKVDISTVANWIDGGKLSAYKTPGGHRRVRGNHLLNFFKQYNMPIPGKLSSLDKERILVVDDDLNVREAITKVLETKDTYEVFIATDGFEAGQAVSDFNPSLVILDIMLPKIDGFKVCKIIKTRDRSIKILAVTGYPTEENKKKILDAGADIFLAKPFAVEALLKNIENLLV